MNNLAKKWLIFCLVLVLVLVLVISVVVYSIDPFFQFRTKDNVYMINEWFSAAGLIKNYDYDTLMIGSSMIQNFDMNLFRSKLGVKPLHIGIGGMHLTEEKELLKLAYETDKANKYYICADMYLFTNESKGNKLPGYLTKNDFLSRGRYFLNYEAWFRYIPIDIAYMLMDRLGFQQSKKAQFSRSIDRFGDWSLDYTFSEDVVVKNYANGKYGVTELEADGLYEKMTTRMDEYFDALQPDKGEHIFFFAPYSMLYWADLSDEKVDILLKGQKYFTEKAMQKGMTVHNFQAEDFTMDLNNYKDTTHYSPEINDWMTEKFTTRDYVVKPENYNEFEKKLLEMRKDFRLQYADLFQ